MSSCATASINHHPDIRRAFDGFHFKCLDIRYSNTNQRQGKAEVTGELVIMNWQPSSLGGLYWDRKMGGPAYVKKTIWIVGKYHF